MPSNLIYAIPTLVDFSSPLVSPGASKSPMSGSGMLRDLAALVLDANLRFLSRAHLQIHRTIGKGLARLVSESGLLDLGYARLGDYAAERLGINARQAQELVWMETRLAKFPLMEQAYQDGHVSYSQVRLLLRRIAVEDEAAWVDRAKGLSVRALEDALNSERPPEPTPGLDNDESGGMWVNAQVTPEVHEKLNIAVEWIRRMVGGKVPLAQCVEYLVAEYLAGPAGTIPPPPTPPQDEPQESVAARVQRNVEEVTKHWSFLDWDIPPVVVAVDLTLPAGANAWTLDECLQRARLLSQRVDGFLMRLLFTLSRFGLHRDMVFYGMGHYVRERLAMNPRTAQSLVALQRAFYYHPTVATAFYSGAIHRTHADLLCRVTCEDTAADWIAYARRTTVKHLKKTVAEAEARRGVYCCVAPPTAVTTENPPTETPPIDDANMCAPKTVRFRLPNDVVPLWTAAVNACEEENGVSLKDGQCLEQFIDAFLLEWSPGASQSTRKNPLMERDDWCCTVPVCTVQTELHDHHLNYRSHGGTDEPINRSSLCNSHHLKGEHEGRLHVSGTAPDALRFALGLRTDGPPHMIVENGTIIYPPPPTLQFQLDLAPQHSARILEFH